MQRRPVCYSPQYLRSELRTAALLCCTAAAFALVSQTQPVPALLASVFRGVLMF